MEMQSWSLVCRANSPLLICLLVRLGEYHLLHAVCVYKETNSNNNSNKQTKTKNAQCKKEDQENALGSDRIIDYAHTEFWVNLSLLFLNRPDITVAVDWAPNTNLPTYCCFVTELLSKPLHCRTCMHARHIMTGSPV